MSHYTTRCKRCGKTTQHNEDGCTTCGKNKQAIAKALNNADFEQLSYNKLLKIVKIIKGKLK